MEQISSSCVLILYTYFLQKHYNLLWLFPDAIEDILPQIEHVSPPVLFVACCVNEKVEAEMEEIAVLARIEVRGHMKFLDNSINSTT